jgi:hypothetical protein
MPLHVSWADLHRNYFQKKQQSEKKLGSCLFISQSHGMNAMVVLKIGHDHFLQNLL